MPNYKYSPKKHAENRLAQRYNAKNPRSLVHILQKEIQRGNFKIIAQTTDGIANGYVHYDKTNYLVCYNLNKKRIVTALPKESGSRYDVKIS